MASYSALLAIQAAIYTRLSGDATLTALAPVVNDALEDQVYPYVLVGSATEEPWNTLGGLSAGWGWNTTITVHVYSRYQGDYEALQIAERISQLLNHYAMAVTGYPTVLLEPDETRVLIERPLKVEQRHIVARYRIRVHE